MGFLILVGVIMCCYYSNKQEERKKQDSRGNSIEVICPYCNGRVIIDSEGKWNCPHCKKDFTYYKDKNNQNSYEPKTNNNGGSGIHVNCPYCNDDVVIQSEGTWICPYCSKEFIYRGKRVYKSENACNDAVIIMITLLAKVSKADGVVTQKEISLLSDFLDNKLQLNFEQKKEIQEVFNREKQNFYDYEKYLYKFYDLFSNDRGILVEFLEEIFKFSHEDGGIHPEQEKIIQKAVQVFRLSSYDYEEIKNKYIEDLDKYYSILKCSKNNTNEEIKRSYRKLLMTYHPDKYASKDLPEEMMRFAKEKTQEIQEAYEKIRKSRNF